MVGRGLRRLTAKLVLESLVSEEEVCEEWRGIGSVVGAARPASGALVVVGGARCPSGSKGGSAWSIEVPHMGRATMLSRGGGAVCGRTGQEAKYCGSRIGP